MRVRTLSALLLLICATASAETAYVTDSLRLGIHAAPDTSDRAFENLVSGTALEVLERNTNYARVRLADGREGWVRAAFLVTTKPAAARILELEGRVAELENVASAARAAQLDAENELGRLVAQTRTGAAASAEDTIASLTAANRDYETRLESYRRTLPATWVALALGVALTAGFLAGLWWLDALIRRRHGGFRVY